jgi:uncharacterized repeat protein (TIGR03806 family)
MTPKIKFYTFAGLSRDPLVMGGYRNDSAKSVRYHYGPIVFFLIVLVASCTTKKENVVVLQEEAVDLSSIGKPKLSDYGFFVGELKQLSPAEGVVPYGLNSALFSDYAFKKRFAKIPAGTKASFNHDDVFAFPVGTVLIKNFYYPADFTKPTENIRLLETRLLIHEETEWKTLPYVWNDEQTEAYLDIAGKNIEVRWKHYNGEIKTLSYSVPNMNQCKGCHLRGDKVMPIGPSARQLNGDYAYTHGSKNQLAHWKELNLIDLPDLQSIAKLASYENENESVELRARAWLEINCAHCHRHDGPAKTSGLHLLASVTDARVLGVGKAPVAAGKGSGGRLYSIVPGKPDESILQYRIESTHPGIMMPELGRKLTHEEGVALVRKWIEEMR